MPSLKHLRLDLVYIDEYYVGAVIVRLVAGPAGSHLNRLQLICRNYYRSAFERIQEAALKHPHLSLVLSADCGVV